MLERKGGAMATPNVDRHRYSARADHHFHGYYAAYAEGLGHARSSALAEPAAKTWNSRTKTVVVQVERRKLKINNEDTTGKVRPAHGADLQGARRENRFLSKATTM